jgi:benzil reductase ((S)-benzoin forming)
MNVFITGISAGLGRGIAEAALAAGASVWGCSRRKPEGLAGPVAFCPIDLSEAEAGRASLRTWLKTVDHFDRVILNAGVLPPMADLVETSLESLREVMEVNVWANKWVLDVLFEKGRTVDQVVAISSGAAVSGHRGWGGYGISKAALNMLVKLYAAEQPTTHFTALAPGLVDTGMQDALFATPSDPRFPTLDRLKAAKGTEAMPDGRTAGRRCWEAFPRLREEASGAFVDLRKMSCGG